MRWSKLRSLIEGRFAASLRRRIAIHSAAYGNCSCRPCWITLNQDVIANFCTRAYYNKKLQHIVGDNPIYKHQLVMYGEQSRQGAYKSMFDFVHTLSLTQALKSDDVLLQALSVADSRMGKRRLSTIAADQLHPLARSLLETRRCAEAGSIPRGA